MSTKCAFSSLASFECIAIIAHLFLKTDEPSKSIFRSRNQSSRRRDYRHLSLSPLFRSKGKELRFILVFLEVGIGCISAHRPTGERPPEMGPVSETEPGLNGAPRVAAGASRPSYLGLLEARVLRCRFERQRDTRPFVPRLPGTATLREFRVGWMRGR